MRLLKFIGRQVMFLLVGSRRVTKDTHSLRDQLRGLSKELESVSASLAVHERLAGSLELLERRVDFLYAHSENVTHHLHELETRVVTSTESVSEVSSSVFAEISVLNASMIQHQEQLRNSLRMSIDDLSDRVVALTARLNESQ